MVKMIDGQMSSVMMFQFKRYVSDSCMCLYVIH